MAKDNIPGLIQINPEAFAQLEREVEERLRKLKDVPHCTSCGRQYERHEFDRHDGHARCFRCPDCLYIDTKSITVTKGA